MVVRFGVHRNKAFGIGDAAGIAKSAVAGLDPFAGVGPTVALAYHTVEGSQLLLDHIPNIDKDIVIVAATGTPNVARQGSRARAKEENLCHFVRWIAVTRIDTAGQRNRA